MHPVYRVHQVSDQHRIQRIVGLPLSWVEPFPASSFKSPEAIDTGITLWAPDAPKWETDGTYDPHFTATREYVEGSPTHAGAEVSLDWGTRPTGEEKAEYPGWSELEDDMHTQRRTNPHSRPNPTTHIDDADVDAWIANAEAAQQLTKLTPSTPVVEEPEHRWRYKPYTYLVKFDECPRCKGNPRPFAAKACRYCKGNGGWERTSVRMTPYNPLLTAPRVDDDGRTYIPSGRDNLVDGYQLSPPRDMEVTSRDISNLTLAEAMVLLGRGKKAGYDTGLIAEQGVKYLMWRNPTPYRNTPSWRTNGPFYGPAKDPRTGEIFRPNARRDAERLWAEGHVHLADTLTQLKAA